jgi:hypothetical protein
MVTSGDAPAVTSSTVTTPARTVAAVHVNHPGDQTMTDDPQPASAQAALERLAAALDPRDHITTLTTGPSHPPRLTVTSRHAQLGDDIYADDNSYWWSWAEPIAAVDDPLSAARKITSVLRPAQEATRG